MAATQHLHYASNFQPAIVVARLTRVPAALELLRRLDGCSLTMAELGLDAGGQTLLRHLRQVNLVTAYQIGDTIRYRSHRYPPTVRRALAEDEAGKAQAHAAQANATPPLRSAGDKAPSRLRIR